MEMKCPSCAFVNIPGSDYCEECLHSLMQIDLPSPRKNDALQSAILTVRTSELLTGKDLLVARKIDSVLKIVKILQREKKDCVLIYERKSLIGILSQRDLLRKAVGSNQDLSKLKVESVMTRKPETVRPEDPIALVLNKMAMGGYRHVPVLKEDGSPLSIISVKDIFCYLSSRSD
jgi:CBS domain-containing protein